MCGAQVLRSLRGKTAARRSYVRSIPFERYTAILKSNLNAEILAAFVEVLREEIKAEPEWCRACLASLEGVERFTVMAKLIPKATQSALDKLRAALPT